MSCFIVSDETMHRVVLALDTYSPVECRDDIDRTELGAKLFEMNNDAFKARYDDRYPEDLYNPTAYAYEHREATTGELYKALACFTYQCSEGDVPEMPLYKLCSQVEGKLELELVGVECPPDQRSNCAMSMVHNVPWDF